MIDEMLWQTILAYAAVILAAIWLLRRMYRVVAGALGGSKSPVSSCSGCPNASSGKSPSGGKAIVRPLVQIGGKADSNR